MPVTSKELAERTGATYRQIDYWCRRGTIKPIGSSMPGSGGRRQFADADVDKIKVLVQISRTFDSWNIAGVLESIYENYEEGEFKFNNGLVLRWQKQ